MRISAIKILLATDGSEEAILAAEAAAELAKDSDSELHVVTVGPFVPAVFADREEEPGRMAREARGTLDEQVRRIKADHGTEAQAHLKVGGGGRGGRRPGRGHRGRADSDGQQGARRDKTSVDGQCLREGRAPRPRPGHDNSRVRTLFGRTPRARISRVAAGWGP